MRKRKMIWTKCSERIPEQFVDVITVIVFDDIGPKQMIGYVAPRPAQVGDKTLALYISDGRHYVPLEWVSHWMDTPPMPEDV